MTRKPDPFARAVCREPGRNPQLWDSDATVEDQAIAAALCGRCPSAFACFAYAESLGPEADGIYAGDLYRRTDTDDPDVVEYLSMLGYEIGDNGHAPPAHPSQLALNLDLPTAPAHPDEAAGTLFA